MPGTEHRTPRLEGLLSALRGRLVRQIWLHGVGTVLTVLGIWLLFSYTADRWLHLPAAIRVFHSLVLIALPIYFFRRDLLRLLRRIPDRSGLALLVERCVPQSGERFVSAVQLAPAADDPVRGGLIQRVLAEADEVAGAVELSSVVDPSRPRRRFGVGLLATVTAVGALAAQPAMATIFLKRMTGSDIAWPRRTSLSIEIPNAPGRSQVASGSDELFVRTARGSDLPIFVHVEGELPESVTLHFESGAVLDLPSTGQSPFRTLLRSVQGDLAFYATGGDDRRGRPIVRVEVLQPPDVAGLAFAVTPPAYSGLPQRVVRDTEVSVLEGSSVRIHVLPDPPEARGVARTFPDDRELALEPAPFPQAPKSARDGGSATDASGGSGGSEDPDGPDQDPGFAPGLAFDTLAEESLRFRVELVDESGLPNPDPGLFGIEVRKDRRPELVTLAPGRAEVEVVPGGAVPLRMRLQDDYGLAEAEWTVRDAQGQDPETDPVVGRGTLVLVSIDPTAGDGARVAALARTRLEVDELGDMGPPTEGRTLLLQVRALDNRRPTANETLSGVVRLRVVGADDFLRRLQDGLARAGEDAERLSRLGEDSGRALRDLGATVTGDDAEMPGAPELNSLANDIRRVEGDARALARDLSSVAESLVYSRLDPRGGALLDRLEAAMASVSDRSFHEESWRTVADELSAGRLGQPELAGDLVLLVGLALDVSGPRTGELIAALDAARASQGLDDARAALTEASQKHEALQVAVEELVVKLGAWDSFQSVLTLTRDILSRQRNLNQRTRKHAEDK